MIFFDPDLIAVSSPATGNSQRIEPSDRLPSARTLMPFLREAQTSVRLRGMVSVLLTTDAAIRRLNRTFRGKNKATDVLSFPAAPMSRGEVAGDLAISAPMALKQAREHGHALSAEIKILMLHGLLHLAGYDHETDEGQMARRERTLRAKLKLPVGLIERSAHPTLAPERMRKDGARNSRLEDKREQKHPQILRPPLAKRASVATQEDRAGSGGRAKRRVKGGHA